MSRQRKLLPEEVERILERVRRGEYLSQIHRETGFNTTIIRVTAHRAGLVIQRCTDAEIAANARKGRNAKKAPIRVVASPVMSMEQYWKGMKASLRW